MHGDRVEHYALIIMAFIILLVALFLLLRMMAHVG